VAAKSSNRSQSHIVNEKYKKIRAAATAPTMPDRWDTDHAEAGAAQLVQDHDTVEDFIALGVGSCLHELAKYSPLTCFVFVCVGSMHVFRSPFLTL
jgi:hypothetical protein